MTPEINKDNIIVRKKLMYLASKNIVQASLAVLINSIIITLVFWSSVDKIVLSLWLFTIVTLLIIRNINTYKYLKNKELFSLEVEENKFKRLALVTAIVMSAGIFYILPIDKPFEQAFLTMIMAGLSAGTVMSLSIYKELTRNYLIILLLPFIYAMYSLGSDMHMYMAILIALFLILLISFSKTYHKSIIDLIISKLLNEQTQKEKEVLHDNFHTIFKEAPIGVFTYDTKLHIQQANQTFAALLNAPIEMLIDLDMNELPDKSIHPTLNLILKGKKGAYEGEYHTKISNEEVWINMQTVPMYDSEHNIIGGLGIVENITSRIKSEQKIHHQAFYDSLTGLANRSTLNDRIKQQIPRLIRNKHYGAILFIDLDHFKTINDSLGHDIGDILLKSFASRASMSIRKEDTVARLGGDEFVVLLSDLGYNASESIKQANHIANKLHTMMKKPIHIQDNSLYISLSIGITIIGQKQETVNDILKHADIAMYKAKQLGRNTTCFFEKEMSEKIQEELHLNNELHNAIKLNEFVLYYQPIVNIKKDKITSCEALIRWNHPQKGLVFPDDFIPHAEQTDMIIEIGDWVIDEACKQYKICNGKLNDIAINISSKQFLQEDFVSKILNATKKHDIHPSALKLELTESVIIDNLKLTIEKMNILKSYGIKMAMDDFGTGYSSLSYLKNLPFDFIKVDRSFVKDMLINKDDASLVKTILSISKQLNFELIAEGVETQEQIDFLKELDYDYYQGYVKSKPIPAEEFKALLLLDAK